MIGEILLTGRMYLLQSFCQGEQWVGRGRFVGVIPAMHVITRENAFRYFGRETMGVAKVARYIFEKEDGEYIILPDADRNAAFEAP